MAANAPSKRMKKLINKVDDLVPESLAGLGAAHPDLVRIDAANNVVIRKDAPKQGKVGIISGGGSGHEPMHGGYVGLGMLDAVLELIPTARVGHIGLQRDEMTAIASQYYSKLPPDMSGAFILMIDPMLATGGSAVAALDLIRKAGGRDVRMICIVAAPEGIALVEQHHPDVHIYTPVVDEGLNAHKYIVPGLGDFGDRLYGT